jgi:hypothetical protein
MDPTTSAEDQKASAYFNANVFTLPPTLPQNELFEDLVPAPADLGEGGVKIERIVSAGQTTPEGEW